MCEMLPEQHPIRILVQSICDYYSWLNTAGICAGSNHFSFVPVSQFFIKIHSPEIYRQDPVHSNPCPACTLIPWCSAPGAAFDHFLKDKIFRCRPTRKNNENARAEHKDCIKGHQNFCLCPLSIAFSLQQLCHPQTHFASKRTSHHCSTRQGPMNDCPFMTCYEWHHEWHQSPEKHYIFSLSFV